MDVCALRGRREGEREAKGSRRGRRSLEEQALAKIESKAAREGGSRGEGRVGKERRGKGPQEPQNLLYGPKFLQRESLFGTSLRLA